MEYSEEEFYTVYQRAEGEIVVRKSRFIATVTPAQSEEAALKFIEEIKKKYWDASHNCYAYIIGTGNPLLRCNDDGEPGRTAGMPMLEVLSARGLTNLVVVVTRYFGGTLLGTGGLVKAYQSATIEGLNKSILIKKELGNRLQLMTDYNLIGKIQYYLGQEAFTILSSAYTDKVTLEVLVPVAKTAGFIDKISEFTNNSATVRKKEQAYFSLIDHEVHLF